ncbi:hypothetical protein [Amnibacterium kyonggiense]
MSRRPRADAWRSTAAALEGSRSVPIPQAGPASDATDVRLANGRLSTVRMANLLRDAR